jgi:hypothetical protein
MPDENSQSAPFFDTFRSVKAKNQARGTGGKFIKKESSEPSLQSQQTTTPNPLFSISNTVTKDPDPPLVNASFKITNPIIYIKNWWKRLIGNEGVTIKIKPVTALLIVTVFVSGGLTLNFLNTLRQVTPIVGPYIPVIGSDVLTERAFTGTLETNSKGTFYLITNLELITLSTTKLPLNALVGKRILVSGQYNNDTKVLYVEDAKDLEVLPIETSSY